MKRLAVSFLVLLAVALIVTLVNLQLTSRDINSNNRKWCALVTTLDRADAQTTTPSKPGTFTAKFVQEIHELRPELGCG